MFVGFGALEAGESNFYANFPVNFEVGEGLNSWV